MIVDVFRVVFTIFHMYNINLEINLNVNLWWTVYTNPALKIN